MQGYVEYEGREKRPNFTLEEEWERLVRRIFYLEVLRVCF